MGRRALPAIAVLIVLSYAWDWTLAALLTAVYGVGALVVWIRRVLQDRSRVPRGVELVQESLRAGAASALGIGLLMLGAGFVFESRRGAVAENFAFSFGVTCAALGAVLIWTMRRGRTRARPLPAGAERIPGAFVRRELLFLPFWAAIGALAYSGRMLGSVAGMFVGVAVALALAAGEISRWESVTGAALLRDVAVRRRSTLFVDPVGLKRTGPSS